MAHPYTLPFFRLSSCLLLKLGALVLLPLLSWGQAALPVNYQGPWAAPSGSGYSSTLGSDYATELCSSATGKSAKFGTQGNYFAVNFSGAPGTLSFCLQGNPASGVTATSGTFDVLESADGTAYTSVLSISNKDATLATYSKALQPASRYVKFVYTTKSSGNIQLDNLQVSSSSTLTTNPTSLGGFTYVAGGGPSASQSYALSGSNLAAGTITVTSAADYEVSLDNGTFGSSATFSNAAGTLASTTIYVRLKAGLAAGSYSNETVTHSGGGAAPAAVTVSGSVAAPAAPSLTTAAASNVGPAAATLNGNISSLGSPAPTTAYGFVYSLTADNATPQLSGAGVTAVSTGTAASVGDYSSSVTGLAAGSYSYQAYATNATGTSYGGVKTFATASPSLTVSALNFEGSGNLAPVYLGGQVNSTTNYVAGYYNLNGTNLGTTPITIKAPAGFQVTNSNSFGSTDGNTLTLTPSNGSISTTLFVRLTAAVLGAYSGSITHTAGPASASVAVAGTVYDYFEDFENGTATSYSTTPTTYALKTGSWTGLNTLFGTSSSDARVDTRSVRIQGQGYLDFTVPKGVGTLSFLAAYYGSDNTAALTVQVSADGSTYTTVAPNPAGALQNNFPATPYTYAINQAGPLHVRFSSTTASKRLTIDDVGLTLPTLTATPNALALTAIPGETSAASTYTLSGTGLPAGATVSLASGNAAVQLSLDGSTYAGSATLTTTGSTLAQTVYVRYAPPAGATGSSTYTISNTTGALSAPVSVAATPAAVYTWSATGNSASWSAASSWTPARSAPAATDVLRFAGSTSTAATVVLDYAGSQTIGQLVLNDGQAHTFSTDASRTLIISNGSTGTDFSVANGTSLTLYSAGSAAAGLTVQLGSGATASLGGRLGFDAAAAGTGQHQLLGSGAAGSVEFASGAVFVAAAGLVGYAFAPGPGSTGLAGNVVFRSGSRYERIGGGNPFVLPAPAAVASFEPGSTFVFAPTSADAPSLGGRTYGHLEYNLPGLTATSTESGQLTVAGSLTLTAGTAALNLPDGVLLKGDLLLNGGSLSFGSNGAAQTVQLGGATAQTIGGSASGLGGLSFGSSTTVQVNNAAGVVLGRPVVVPGTLQLSNGLLTTTATNILTLAGTATVSGGSGASFVSGPVRRPVADISTPTSFVFPVGKGAAYRPLVLTVNSQTGTTTYRAEQFEGNADRSLASPDPSGAPLARVSTRRYFTLTPYSSDPVPVVAQPQNFTGTVTVSFGADDAVSDPTAATLVVAKRSGATQPWYNFGHSADSGAGTAGGGTLTSGLITSFSDFALGSTAASAANPLPVQLTAFTAARSSGGPVALAWATASEVNSLRFEVERSLDGRAFSKVAEVAAQGSSIQARHYGVRDATAPAQLLYYRLRLVDQDGSFRYSAVATVAAGPAGELALNPNPAREQVSFYTEQPATYALRSMLGQVLRQGTAPAGLTQLDLRELASGTYLLELHTPAGRVVRRLVKE